MPKLYGAIKIYAGARARSQRHDHDADTERCGGAAAVSSPHPSVLYCCNDWWTAGVLRARCTLRLPRDLCLTTIVYTERQYTTGQFGRCKFPPEFTVHDFLRNSLCMTGIYCSRYPKLLQINSVSSKFLQTNMTYTATTRTTKRNNISLELWTVGW